MEVALYVCIKYVSKHAKNVCASTKIHIVTDTER